MFMDTSDLCTFLGILSLAERMRARRRRLSRRSCRKPCVSANFHPRLIRVQMGEEIRTLDRRIRKQWNAMHQRTRSICICARLPLGVSYWRVRFRCTSFLFVSISYARDADASYAQAHIPPVPSTTVGATKRYPRPHPIPSLPAT